MVPLLVAMLGCAMPLGIDETSKVFTSDPGPFHIEDTPYAVSLQQFRTGVFRPTCSGTLIDNQTVLTAAHCFRHGDGPMFDEQGNPQRSWRVVAGTSDLSQPKHVREIAAIAIHERRVALDAPRCFLTPTHHDIARFQREAQFDIALLRLSEPLDLSLPELASAGVARTAPEPGTEVRLVGYGINVARSDGYEPKLRWARMPVQPAPTTPSRAWPPPWRGEWSTPQGMLFVGGAASGEDNESVRPAACPGDSGGPQVLERDGEAPIVVGVASHNTPGSASLCYAGDVLRAVDVSQFTDWIETTTTALSQHRGYFAESPCFDPNVAPDELAAGLARANVGTFESSGSLPAGESGDLMMIALPYYDRPARFFELVLAVREWPDGETQELEVEFRSADGETQTVSAPTSVQVGDRLVEKTYRIQNPGNLVEARIRVRHPGTVDARNVWYNYGHVVVGRDLARN